MQVVVRRWLWIIGPLAADKARRTRLGNPNRDCERRRSRRLKSLELVEQRELKSLEVALLQERRIEERERREGSRAPQEPARMHSNEFNEVAAKQPEPAKDAEGGTESVRSTSGETMGMPSPSYSAGLEFELTGVAQSVELA